MAFEAIDSDAIEGAFWRTLGERPVGATLVTGCSGGIRAGFLGLSFAHVSARPALVLVSVGKSASALDTIRASGAFAVIFLPAGLADLAKSFGRSADRDDRFKDDIWTDFVTGAPVLRQATGVFDCTVATVVETESAVVVLGKVVGLRIGDGPGSTLAVAGGFRDYLP